MLFQYANVAFGLLFGCAFVLLNVLVLSRLLAPRVRSEEKLTTYECGEPAVGSAQVRFDMRFYTTALVFLIFEVEVAFLFPWAAVYNSFVVLGREQGVGAALFPLVEVAIFVAVLGVGLVYVWAKGDLDWVKATISGEQDVRARSGPAGERAAGERDLVGAEPRA